MNKKIAIIGTVGLPAKYGGFETLAEHLVIQKGENYDFLVYCSKKVYPNGPEGKVNAALKFLPLNANGLQSIPYDIWGIFHGLRKTDTLLILGVSGCIILPFVKLFSKKKIAVNIDGLEWKRGKWGSFAKKYLKFSERLAVKYADSVIADNKVIQEHVKNNYNCEAHLIAYGADHTFREEISEETLEEFSFLKNHYAFKVCRIEPENNVEMILKSFAQFTRLNLVLVGNWDKSEYSKNLKREFEKFDNIFLLDPIYDQKKLNQLRSNCYLYVHGHSAGGTNPSLVEAMYLKLPILAFGVNYNRETTADKAIYFECENSLIKILNNLDELNLVKIANEMSLVANEKYKWSFVADRYSEILN